MILFDSGVKILNIPKTEHYFQIFITVVCNLILYLDYSDCQSIFIPHKFEGINFSILHYPRIFGGIKLNTNRGLLRKSMNTRPTFYETRLVRSKRTWDSPKADRQTNEKRSS